MVGIALALMLAGSEGFSTGLGDAHWVGWEWRDCLVAETRWQDRGEMRRGAVTKRRSPEACLRIYSDAPWTFAIRCVDPFEGEWLQAREVSESPLCEEKRGL